MKIFVVLLVTFSVAGVAAPHQLEADRLLQSVHSTEVTAMNPSYGQSVPGGIESIKALEASVQRPVLENPYQLRVLKYFSKNPLVAFALIVALLISLPIAFALRHED